MDKKYLKKGAWAAGGVALLAVTSALCVKGLQAVEKRLKAKKEAATAEAAEAELFEDAAATEPVDLAESVEETAEEIAEATEAVVEEVAEKAETIAEEIAGAAETAVETFAESVEVVVNKIVAEEEPKENNEY